MADSDGFFERGVMPIDPPRVLQKGNRSRYACVALLVYFVALATVGPHLCGMLFEETRDAVGLWLNLLGLWWLAAVVITGGSEGALS